MAKIRQDLLRRLQRELALSQAQVYKRIAEKVRNTHLPRELAAIAVASESGINISKFATPQELAELRQGFRPASASLQPVTYAEQKTTKKPTRKGKSKPSQKRRGNSVFVVHGRNEKLRRALFSFLRSIALNPLEWRKAIALTRKPSPYVGEILDTAFRHAVAVVVLFSPDDDARLKSQFVKPSDPPHEKKLTGQPRPNVLFEAGMAFARNPESTVLVQVGQVRPFSDIAGRHLVHLSNSPETRQELITKLKSAGCNVDDNGADWLTEGDFSHP